MKDSYQKQISNKLMDDRIGEIDSNAYGTLMKIVEYIDSHNILVEFQDEYKYRTKTTYHSFKNNNVKNPYDKVVFNVGYIGDGYYTQKEYPEIYSVWHGMIRRCYDEKFFVSHPTYSECYVCDEWLNFQNFASWWEVNYYEVPHENVVLDKDIIYKGNRVYSPETCVFVPESINALFTKRQNCRGDLPIGCSINKNRIIVRCCDGNGNRAVVGRFPIGCELEAFNAYKLFKESVIKDIAENYSYIIPDILYHAMINYEVEIDD